MNQIIMTVFAAGVLLGGADYLFGNKRGYGDRFEEGFRLLGPTALSMTGMICLSPALSRLLRLTVSRLLQLAGIDPAMAGGLFAIDMGGYQLAMQLADDPAWGRYAGIIIAAIFGCTLIFTLPVGMGLIEPSDSDYFLKGMIIGMIAMPAGFLAGGAACGFPLSALLLQLSPILLCAVALILGLLKIPGTMLRLFRLFARFLKTLITLGLIAGAVCYLLQLQTEWITPVMDAMAVVSSICVVMLGSLPTALFLQRLLRRPLHRLGSLLGLDDTAVTAILIGTVSVIPAITMLKDMTGRGKTAVCAYLVSAASLLGAHVAFTAGVDPDMTGPLILAKLTGAAAALILALLLERRAKV